VAGRVDPQATAPPAPEPAPAAATQLTAVDRLPILLVDDVPENLRTLEAVLSPLGFPLVSASSGDQALRLLLERDFALILLDVLMPGLNGLETARIIKQRERTRETPVVFLTAARDEVRDIIRGYGIGAVDYVLKPFDAELLRSKVAVFVELEASRRALKRSEAFLRGAFEAAPVGKTVLDQQRRIVRSNPAFAALVGAEPAELQGVSIVELCHPEDRHAVEEILDRVAREGRRGIVDDTVSVDLRLAPPLGAEVWVGVVASAIDPIDLTEPLLLAQWVDLSIRRRAEQARAELLVEQAARAQAEALNERLATLQSLSAAIESLSLDELLPELAMRLSQLFAADLAEVEVSEGVDEPLRFRAAGGEAHLIGPSGSPPPAERVHEEPVMIETHAVGCLRLGFSAGRSLSVAERSLLRDAADRASLGIRRALLHEEEHRIAVELQRGLLPKQLPKLDRIELAAHYEAAGIGAEVGGDWYDAFALSDGRLGIVLGDVAGRSIPAASAMGQLRTVTRAFALAEAGTEPPGEVLGKLNRYQLALADEELFTVIYAILDPDAGTISFANAGHPPPLVRAADGTVSYLEGGDGLIGLEDVTYSTCEAPLGEGSTVVLYTDGLVERRGETLDAGLDRLAQAVRSGPATPLELCDYVLENLLPPDGRLSDDVTAVLARVAQT
jgi:PAS domain S-box-containing protein